MVACESASYLPINTNGSKIVLADGSRKYVTNFQTVDETVAAPNNMIWC